MNELFEMSDASKGPIESPDGMISFHSPVSESFINAISASWYNIPSAFRDFLGQKDFLGNHYSISVGFVMTDIPEGNTLSVPGDIYDRNSPNKIQAIYAPGHKKAFISEYFLSPEANPSSAPTAPSTESLNAGIWKRTGSFVDYAVPHESAHAFDHALGNLTGTVASSAPDFVAAYEEDLKNLGGIEGAAGKGYADWARANPFASVGRAEIFADLMTLGLGNHANPFESDWPSVANYMQKLQKDFYSSYCNGPDDPKFLNFLDRFAGASHPPTRISPAERASVQKGSETAGEVKGADEAMLAPNAPLSYNKIGFTRPTKLIS